MFFILLSQIICWTSVIKKKYTIKYVNTLDFANNILLTPIRFPNTIFNFGHIFHFVINKLNQLCMQTHIWLYMHQTWDKRNFGNQSKSRGSCRLSPHFTSFLEWNWNALGRSFLNKFHWWFLAYQTHESPTFHSFDWHPHFSSYSCTRY